MNLCLISSNIRFDNPSDGQNAWPSRREILAKTLLTHSPDLIATQEGRYHQLKDLETLLDDYDIVDSHRSWIKERMYPSFFIKKNTFEFIQSRDVWLSQTPEVAGSTSFGSAFPRLMTWVKLQPKNSNSIFLFSNCHLDHVLEATRIAQVQVMIQQILSIKTGYNKLIIMGDFNDSPKSKIRKLIDKNFPNLHDGWIKFNSNEETSHHAFSGECQNGSRIDWILTDRSLNVENCFLDKSSHNGQFPSDHFPVVCKIRI